MPSAAVMLYQIWRSAISPGQFIIFTTDSYHLAIRILLSPAFASIILFFPAALLFSLSNYFICIIQVVYRSLKRNTFA
jgi:hypothetical protein